jgi:hypothetical protein
MLIYKTSNKMASIYYYDSPNETNIRTKRTKTDEMWVLNPATNEYERIIPGGGDGPPVAIPYYLKQNSIDIDEGTNGTELTATALTFGDSAGNVSIDKTKAKTLDDLHNMLESATPNAGTNNVLIGYNPTTKKIIRNPSVVYLWNSAGVNAKLAPSYLTLMAPTTYTNINTSSVRLSDTAGLNTIGLDNPTGIPSLQITKANTTLRFHHEDIEVTNKLKSLAAGTPGPESKMLIYDTTTKAFNHATIPSGGGADLPSYIKPNSIDLVTTSMEGSTIKISDPTSASLLRAGYLTLQKISGTTTNANLTFNGVKAVENLEALSTTPRLGKKLVVYDPTTKVFNHADQNPNELTATMVNNSIVHQKWKPINVAGSEFYAPNAEEWGFRPVRRWLDIKKTGDTLFIDCSNYSVPMTNGSKVKMVFDVGLFGAAMLDATYENANITASCLYSQVVYKTGIPIQNEVTNMRWLYTLTLTATATTNLNAMIRIKVVDEIAGIRSNVEVVEPTLL